MPFRFLSGLFLILLYPMYAYAQQTEISPDGVDDRIIIHGKPAVASVQRLTQRRVSSSDSATLLQDEPGVSLYSAGGISSLPALHGMADDRIRVQLDGMDLIPSCPNHMNSPLSVMDPVSVRAVRVLPGITPVSAGGDSIAGTIQVTTAAPEFATDDEQAFSTGQTGTFYRSNGNAHGANLNATHATQTVNLTYDGSTATSGDVSAAQPFKPAGYADPGHRWLAGAVIGSTAYQTENNRIGVALRHESQLLELSAGVQIVASELFPTQRMDMTNNRSEHVNLHYSAHNALGEFEVRAFEQITHHTMDFGPDKQLQYGAATGMPMKTDGITRAISLTTTTPISARSSLKLGGEYLNYRLNDVWPAATATTGMMGPSTFLNVNNGRRIRAAGFVEMDTLWSEQWFTQWGWRTEAVRSDADDVQGYNTTPDYAGDAAHFNSTSHQRTDLMNDLSLLARYTPSGDIGFELGYAEKNRAPNLYERYTWSAVTMAAIMNNFIGDGNGYIGNLNLRPEIARTVSGAWDMHDASSAGWQIRFSPYVTSISDFINATRCPPAYSANCSISNLTGRSGFVTLQFVNQSAQIYGADLSGFVTVARSSDYGDIKLRGVINLVRGENTTTGDSLYNFMPLNSRLTLQQENGRWTNAIDWQMVAAKSAVSALQNENRTAGYGLLNLRSSFSWKKFRADLAIENLLNRSYDLPLGGAYVGQGATMGINALPWGVQLPGNARSINMAFRVQF